MKRNSMLVIGLFALTTLVGAKALAGYEWGVNVYINPTIRVAEGTMGTVRSSADSVQQIGCAVRAYAGQGIASVYCTAKDSTGQSAQCSVADPAFVQAASAMASNSHISFKWNASGICTYLGVENYSSNAPIEP